MLAVKYADGFNTPNSLEECRAIIAAVRENCQRYGRRFEDLVVSSQGFILIGRSQSEIQAILERTAHRRDLSLAALKQQAVDRGWLIGEPDYCALELGKFREIGVNHVMLSFVNDVEASSMELFMDKVVPKLK